MTIRQAVPFRRCGRCVSECDTQCAIKIERTKQAMRARWGPTEGEPVHVHRGTRNDL